MQTLVDDWSGFQFLPAAEFADDPEAVPDHEGLYLICFSEAGGLPPRAREVAGRESTDSDDYSVLYIGQTGSNLRARLDCHLLNTAWVSSFRKTAGLLMKEPLGLEPQLGWGGARNWAFGFEGESVLTDWMLSDAVIGFKQSDDPLCEERSLIQVHSPLLNIEGRRLTEEGKRLERLRRTVLPLRPKRPMRRARPQFCTRQ